ncbi:pilus assembly protein TadG-related protein [Alcaligenes sp. Marseille-Q7550]
MNGFGIRERAQRADRQTGSVIVPAAAALLVGLVLLGAAQLGQNFYAKRDLQNAADLAALAGAQSWGRAMSWAAGRPSAWPGSACAARAGRRRPA